MRPINGRSNEPIHDLGGSEHVPVVLLGGAESAVACARRFTRTGLTTVVVNQQEAPALRSRGVVAESLGADITSDSFVDWLFGPGRRWSGAVVIPLSDIALAALIDNHHDLASVYRLATLDPDVARAMLDKQTTVQLATEAGIATPKQWIHCGPLGPDVLSEFEYPLVLKPRHGFELIRQAGTKHYRVADENELRAHLKVMESLPGGFVINEFIPGGDSELSSYYALRGADGEVHVEFTKRVDRRCPPHKGGATFHELVDLPATAAAGRKFFDHIGLVGLGNVEFKRDHRTDELKIIECNHRMTAAMPLMQACGIDLAGAVYQQALGLVPTAGTGRHGTLWYPVRDLISFRTSGDGLTEWIRRPWRSTMPYWQLRDPAPSLHLWRRSTARSLRKRLRRLTRSSGS